MHTFDEIIVHIGLHKTGTTSIQHSLLKNRDTLSSLGYYFPAFNIGNGIMANHSRALVNLFSDNPENYKLNITSGYDTKEKCQSLSKTLLQQFSSGIKTSHHKLILSGEGLTTLTEHELENLKKFLDSHLSLQGKIKVFAYLRHPVNYYQSVIQELVKSGFGKADSFNMAMGGSKSLYTKTLNKFISVFGKHSIALYRFEDTIEDSTPDLFFFKLLEAKDNLDKIISVRANESLSAEAFELISAINTEQPLFINGKLNPKRKGDDTFFLRNLKGSRFGIPENTKTVIWNNIQPDLTWLNEQFSINYVQNNSNDDSKQETLWSVQTLDHLISISEKASPIISGLLANALRDLAIQFESSDVTKALNLMRTAKHFRPNGPIINKKIDKYLKLV